MVQRDYQYAKVMTLYVGNLAARVDEPILINTFNSIGPITNVQVCSLPWPLLMDQAHGI